MTKNKGQKIGVLKKSDGQFTSPWKDTIKELISTHFPTATERMSSKYGSDYKLTTDIDETRFDWINKNLIKEAMFGFKSKKSPGPDGLTSKPIIFKYLTDNIIEEIEFIYKACIMFSFTPTKWKILR